MTSHWQAVIVDDERLARRELRTLLKEHPSVSVVAEADTIAGALERVRLTGANLVLLDVQLANDENGLDLIPMLDPAVAVILVTAFDQYAVHAFDVEARDYLLKPVRPSRLARALGRLPHPRTPRVDPVEEESTALAAEPASRLMLTDRLFLRMDDRMGFLPVASIRALTALRDDSRVLLSDGRAVLIRKSLAEWEARLPAEFLRIHRSTIVQLAQVERVDEWSHGSFLVRLRGVAEPFVMSRRYAARVRARLA